MKIMNNSINQVSIGIFIGQIVMLAVSIVILYFLIKLYRKIMKYLDKKI